MVRDTVSVCKSGFYCFYSSLELGAKCGSKGVSGGRGKRARVLDEMRKRRVIQGNFN